MTSVMQKSDPVDKVKVEYHCVLDKDKSIKTLSLNGLKIIQDGTLTASSYLNDGDISCLKDGLNEIFPQHEYKSENGKFFLSPKTLIVKIFPIESEASSAILSSQTAARIQKFCSKIERIKDIETIVSEVKTHNIEQLNNKPNTNRKLTALFLILFVIGLLAGIIGIGALLPQVGVIKPSLGIVGIPFGVSIVLVAIGTATIASMGILKFASKKSNLAKEYLNDILRMRSQAFLESNLNDFANVFLFILVALTFIHAPWIKTLTGCLAYPSGILTIGSGLYQGLESYKSLKNAKQTNNKEQLLMSVLNIASSIAILLFGSLTVIGKMNTGIAVASMLVCQALRVIVAGIGMKKSYKTIKEINKVKTPEEIIKFFQNNLELNNEEIENIEKTISEMHTLAIEDWIIKNKNKWTKEQQQKFEEIYKKLQNAQDLKIEEIEKIKQLILNEEIKNALEKKRESLRFLLKETTFKELLENFEKIKKNESDLKILFEKVKKEIYLKTFAEIMKFFILYIPLTIIPFLNVKGLINTKIYDYFLSALCGLDLAINITPRFRNVPPATIKKPLDINEKIKNAYYDSLPVRPIQKKQRKISHPGIYMLSKAYQN